MTAPWLRFRNAAPAAEEATEVLRGGIGPRYDDFGNPRPLPGAPQGQAAGPWQRFQETTAPEFPEGEISLPQVNMTMQAAPELSPQREDVSLGQGLMEGLENTYRGAAQGTKPYSYKGDERQVLGEIKWEDDGGNQIFLDGQGQERVVDPKTMVVLRDPGTGKLTAYSRAAASDEGGFAGATRLISQGMLTGPVTGPARSTALAGPAAGAVSAGRAAQAAQDAVAFDRAGIRMFAPAFSEGPARGAAKSLADTPVIGAPLNRALDNSLSDTARVAEEISGRLGSKPNPQQAGAGVRQGIERFKDARPADVVGDAIAKLPEQELARIILAPTKETSFKTKQAALYERAWKLIPEKMQKGRAVKGDTRFMSNPAHTREVLEGIVDRNRRMINSKGGTVEPPPMAGGLLGEMIKAIRLPQWPANLQTLREMRSEVRRLASGMADTERNVLKASDLDRIQSALTRDMIEQLQKNVAHYRGMGDLTTADKIERAIGEFARADKYTALSFQRMETIERLFRAETGEQLAANISRAALDGNRGNIEMLRTLSKTLRPDEMGDVRSMLFSELGKPVASARGVAQEAKFSVNTFTTSWNKMSPEAKALLFDGEHRAAIDDFVRVADRLANVESMGNVSRSGQHAINVGGVLAAGGSLVSGSFAPVAGAAAGGYGLSYLLSRPAYARWVTQWLQLKSQVQKAPQAINNALVLQLNRLEQMAKADPALWQIHQSLTGEVGVGEGADQHGDQEQGPAAPAQGVKGQSGQQGKSLHGPDSTTSGGLMINPLLVAQKIKDTAEGYANNEVVERLDGLIPLGKYSDGQVRLAWPSWAKPGVDAIGNMIDNDPSSPTYFDDMAHDAAEGIALIGGGGTLGAQSGAAGAFGGRLFGRAAKGAEAELAAVKAEIEELAPRYRELFGKGYASPRAPSGTPAAEVLAGERQSLEAMKTAIARKEQELGARSQLGSVPRTDNIEAERAEMLRQAEANPYAVAVKGRQGLIKKEDRLKDLNKAFDAGERAPASARAWGYGPEDYKGVLKNEYGRQAAEAKAKFDQSRQEIARLKDEKQAAEVAGLKSEVARLTAELKRENEKAVHWQTQYNKMKDFLDKRGKDED